MSSLVIRMKEHLVKCQVEVEGDNITLVIQLMIIFLKMAKAYPMTTIVINNYTFLLKKFKFININYVPHIKL